MTSATSPTAGRIVVALAAGAFLALAAGAAPAAADPPPAGAGTTSHGFVKRGTFTAIDHPDATIVPAALPQAGTGTTGINDRGQILGAYEAKNRPGQLSHFLRDRGRYTGLEDPPGGSNADEYVDINNRGEIVGFYDDDQGVTTTGFLRTRTGRFIDIDVPGSQVTGPLKINDRRQIVGLYVDTRGLHGFRWDRGKFTTIDVRDAAATVVFGINNRGQMVGVYVDTVGAYHAFLRNPSGSVTTLPDAPGAVPTAGGTQPAAINDRGQIVGVALTADGGSRGFVYQRGAFTPIDAPHAVYTRALDINNAGQIVGDYGTKPPTGNRGPTAPRLP
ncbi:MAG TPA: hypothetical protein VH912_21605 [Streptosporangiaceae bacterium]|jgi:probable HAF family extracellular repeat protein